jgi:hypothetical protein
MKRTLFIAGLALAFVTHAHAAAPANFNGSWTANYQGKTIPGALQQQGNQLQGYCIYPGGKRATFQGTANGNTLSGTLYVDQKTQWTVNATLSGNSMSGTWSRGNGKGTPGSATKK